jgi:hypothetical protein
MRDIRSNLNRQFAHAATLFSLALLTALLTQPAHAQAVDNAANPSAKVPAVGYKSVFKETSLGVEKDTDNWRKANDEVGKFTRGHLDILKWEEQEAAKAMKSGMEKPIDKPAAAPAGVMAPKPDATKPVAAPAHKH